MRLTKAQKFEALQAMRRIGVTLNAKFYTDTDVARQVLCFLSTLETHCNHGGRLALRRVERECQSILRRP